MNEKEFSGYTVGYSRDETQFPVYVVVLASAFLLTAAFYTGITWLLALAVAAAGWAYYNFPLLEPNKPQIGANEYGIFVCDFGIIRWSAVGRIDMVPIAERVLTVHELQIVLKQPLGKALVTDWRSMPFWRSLMRLPWTMTHDNVVRVRVDSFDQPPDEIHRTLLRMWKYYKS